MKGKPETIALMAEALWRTLHSVEWIAAVGNYEEQVALLLVEICDALDGGRPIYLPDGVSVREMLARGERDAKIRAAFDGTNYLQLANRFDLSTRQVRRIVDQHSGT